MKTTPPYDSLKLGFPLYFIYVIKTAPLIRPLPNSSKGDIDKGNLLYILYLQMTQKLIKDQW